LLVAQSHTTFGLPDAVAGPDDNYARVGLGKVQKIELSNEESAARSTDLVSWWGRGGKTTLLDRLQLFPMLGRWLEEH
jgi:hypothetical protein